MKKIICAIILLLAVSTAASAAVTIKLRRDTAANWTTNSTVVLAAGEMGVETDTLKTKIGDGVTAWSALSYATEPGGTQSVASGTSALGTSAISSGACASVVTTTATNVATTDVINWGFNGDPTGVTGYAPTANGMLTIIAYPSSGNVNYKVCNNTAASITPGEITINWRVQR